MYLETFPELQIFDGLGFYFCFDNGVVYVLSFMARVVILPLSCAKVWGYVTKPGLGLGLKTWYVDHPGISS